MLPIDEGQIVREYMPIALDVARNISYQNDRPFDDCLSAAQQGLLVAIRSYDPKKNDSIEKWISYKCKMHIIDIVLRHDDFTGADSRLVSKALSDGHNVASRSHARIESIQCKPAQVLHLEWHSIRSAAKHIGIAHSTLSRLIAKLVRDNALPSGVIWNGEKKYIILADGLKDLKAIVKAKPYA